MYESTSVEWVMDEQTTSTLVHLLEKHVYKVNEIVWKLRSASAPRPSYAKSTSMAVWELLVPDLKQESTRLSDSLLPDPSKVNVKPFPDLHGLLDIPRPESIFHVHPRARVPQNDLLPGGKFHAVCKLFVHFNKQEEERFAMATGWLIDEDTVITAGHCAYKPSYGRATDIRIFLGYNGQSSVKTKEVQGRRGKYIAVHWGYFDKCQKEYDLAVIKTDKAFENVTGFLWQDCPIEEKDAQLTVVGYPGDTPANEEGEYMHYSEGKTTFDLRELDYMLLHHLDTAGGNSGGPIIHNNPQGGLKTIGVHCYGGQTHNLASALGHGGNVIHAFKTGLSLMEKKADGLQDGRINATGDPTQAIYRANISLV
ncbi:trypsin-like cysteine/serine peptidase domain-containing protein [Aspergillus pseudocaelatus]|uniref:Trypsin-like cysteine/serine peptidase domain-containing protein n=1 Tax=Aspergillus pseudocaelatus TaxID=1825620 RepID=A0ABQ6W5I7_9EURO|nr:trypsin-like cysteine/serine peptidase domain-containing protein [Aspergillus pseudocaelatus]